MHKDTYSGALTYSPTAAKFLSRCRVKYDWVTLVPFNWGLFTTSNSGVYFHLGTLPLSAFLPFLRAMLRHLDQPRDSSRVDCPPPDLIRNQTSLPQWKSTKSHPPTQVVLDPRRHGQSSLHGMKQYMNTSARLTTHRPSILEQRMGTFVWHARCT